MSSYSTCYTNRTKLTPYARSSGRSGEPGNCTFDPAPGNLVYWKVRAIDATGGSSACGPLRCGEHLPVHLPGRGPEPTSPADTRRPDATLTWDPVDNIERYTVHIREVAAARTPSHLRNSFTPTTLLDQA